MQKYNFKAVIFDLDGVITKTAEVHALAWKNMFDHYLKEHSQKNGIPFVAFDYINDYLPYVDGKPRYNGVKDFLESRNIHLEFGSPEDDIKDETVCGLGNRKNKAFNEVLEKNGVQVFESTVTLMHQLKEHGIKVGVASSSKNCRKVLEAADLMHIVETIVDGTDSAKLGLKGKPQPDIFTTACDQLHIPYDRAVVVEDASSGVAAGKAGNFGLVLGLARENNAAELYKNGADIVVRDIDDIKIDGIEDWFKNGLDDDNWSITYHDYDPTKEKSRESLLAVGNGYFGNRGSMEEVKADEQHYPGTYMAGLYNRLKSPLGDRMIENEDFVNTPKWTLIEFKIDNDPWWDYKSAQFEEYKKRLCLKTGLFTKEFVVKTKEGKRFKVSSKRIASMADMNTAAIEYVFTPLNFSGNIEFRLGIDGNIENRGVTRYNSLNQHHLKFVSGNANENQLNVIVQTTQSNISVAQTVNHSAEIIGRHKLKSHSCFVKDKGAYTTYKVDIKENESIQLNKTLSIFNSLTSHAPLEDSLEHAKTAATFKELYKASKEKWGEIWDELDIQVEGDRLSQKLLRLHSYHMMVSASHFNTQLDASVTARGLHGEAYRGHIFWDELFILPFYNIHFPDISRAMLLYRYHRLPQARNNAKEHGYRGAMFPWQSGSDGREETQTVHLNPITGQWGADNSSLQRHVSLAIAYNIYQYVETTNDWQFFEEYGAEMYLDICRFWASKAKKNLQTGKYSIDKVMGPDEFHEQYPNAKDGGLQDNAYTNIMVAWMLGKVDQLLEKMNCVAEENVLLKLQIPYQEMLSWNEISKHLNLQISEEGIIAQFQGYFDLKELDWEYYRKKYTNIYRMDRLLKAEGKSADDYKVAKQADTLMTFFNLEKPEVDAILAKLGYQLPGDYLEKNLKYYLTRTSHGSSLSRVVHAQLATIIKDDKLSWKMYQEALGSDYIDIQGGTTGEGIHTGVMASTVMVSLTNYAGLHLHSDGMLELHPHLPIHWRRMTFHSKHRGTSYHFDITHSEIKIRANANVVLKINQKNISLEKNKTTTIALN